MKLMHLSDLHLGLRLKEESMLEEQKYILEQILEAADSEKPDAVLLAGDIYDKAIPPAAAVELFDHFLSSLADRDLQVFVISGNHDSAERVAFGAKLMSRAGVHISPVFDGSFTPITLTDTFGPVDFFLLPFIKPAHVRSLMPEEEASAISSYNDAVAYAVSRMHSEPGRRRVLVTHQFITDAKVSGSEITSVGGAENVDTSVFDSFDYVALGHLHGAQFIGREAIRYCGTPLKYSFSEAGQEKSVTIAELAEPGHVTVREIPLKPLHDLRCVTGSYDELTDRRRYIGTAVEDYLHIILTDKNPIPLVQAKLGLIYPNLLSVAYETDGYGTAIHTDGAELSEEKTPSDYLEELYFNQNGCPLSAVQKNLAIRLFREAEEELQ